MIFEGLITVDLPDAVLDGDYFRVVIRRITTCPVLSKKFEMRRSIATVSHSVKEDGAAAPQSEPFHEKKSDGGKSVTRLTSTALVDPRMNAQIPEFTYICQVVGAFQINMPVTNKDVVAGRKYARSAQVAPAGHEAYQPLVSCASSLRRPGESSGRWTWR